MWQELLGFTFFFQANSPKNVLYIRPQRNCRNRQAAPSLQQEGQEAGVMPLLCTNLLPELPAPTSPFPGRGKEGYFICWCVTFLCTCSCHFKINPESSSVDSQQQWLPFPSPSALSHLHQQGEGLVWDLCKRDGRVCIALKAIWAVRSKELPLPSPCFQRAHCWVPFVEWCKTQVTNKQELNEVEKTGSLETWHISVFTLTTLYNW